MNETDIVYYGIEDEEEYEDAMIEKGQFLTEQDETAFHVGVNRYGQL